MMGLETHLRYFPPRIRSALFGFRDWDGVSEIRLRRDLPLSLTHFKGNLFLNADGKPCEIASALRANEEEIRAFVGAFCRGNVYRYFDTLKECFLVDEEGFRLGLCPEKMGAASFLPERFDGINLRIPRSVAGCARPILSFFEDRPLSSTLILSAPGAGKTTILRDLAATLSRGRTGKRPVRVAVVDERREIFPAAFLSDCGLCDVLSGYRKAEGIEIATRLFSPEVIICDEIGNLEEKSSILSAPGSGCILFATAHASSLDMAKTRPVLNAFLESGVFRYAAELTKIPSQTYQNSIRMVEIR